MKELLRTVRLAFYVLALPLVATAVASAAYNWTAQDSQNSTQSILEDVVSALPAPVAIQTNMRHQYVVRMAEDGSFRGRVAAFDPSVAQMMGAARLTVSLNRQGDRVAEAETAADGTFTVSGIEPGSYTFIAASETALATFGLYVVSDPANMPAADEVQIDVVAASESIGMVREIINGEVQAHEYTYAVDPLSDPLAFTAGSCRVQLTAQGAVVGRIIPLSWEDNTGAFDLTGNVVYLLRGDAVVAEASVAPSGAFELPGIQPGMYNFVSVGPHGNAALAVEVVSNANAGTNALLSLSSLMTGLVQEAAPESLNVVLTEPNADAVVEVEVDVPLPGGGYGGMCCAGAAGAGCCGGGGYGGGCGGGYGGFGELAGLALAAFAISELASDDDNDPNVPPPPPPPQSPSQP
jgi:hypothetical protein